GVSVALFAIRDMTPSKCSKPAAPLLLREHGRGSLPHLFRGHVLLVGRNRPLVPEGIEHTATAIAVELIRQWRERRRTRRDRAVEDRVAISHVEHERNRRAADRLRAARIS